MAATRSDDRQTGAEAKARRMAEELSAQVNNLQSELKTLSAQVGEMAGEKLGRAQDQATETLAHAEDAVRRNPSLTVALALGTGFLLGLILRR